MSKHIQILFPSKFSTYFKEYLEMILENVATIHSVNFLKPLKPHITGNIYWDHTNREYYMQDYRVNGMIKYVRKSFLVVRRSRRIFERIAEFCKGVDGSAKNPFLQERAKVAI